MIYKLNLKEDYHIHCNYNDHSSPDLTISNVVHRAEKLKLETIAFTEHVRKGSDWIEKYLEELKSVKSSIKILSGFEAKILKDGSIDCPEQFLKDYFIVASFHTIYSDKSIWKNALEKAVQNPSVNVIGHLAPEPTFNLGNSEVHDLAQLFNENKKILELNAKYQRPPLEWIPIFKEHGVRFHLGSDAHSLEQIGDYNKIINLIRLVDDCSADVTK
jgi:histidinol phosphatase-like PHP family hydrolase